MGVMECSRNSCKRILCDTYIDGIGYVCNDCQKEFKRYISINKHNPEEMKHNDLINELKDFVEIPKDLYSKKEIISVNDFFNEYRGKNQ